MADQKQSTADMLNAAIRSHSAVPVDAYNPAKPNPGIGPVPQPQAGNSPKTFKPIAARATKRGKR